MQKLDDQLELTYSNYVRTQDVTLKTCRRRWMIGRSGERASGISELEARYDDDDKISSSLLTKSIFLWLFSEEKREKKEFLKDKPLVGSGFQMLHLYIYIYIWVCACVYTCVCVVCTQLRTKLKRRRTTHEWRCKIFLESSASILIGCLRHWLITSTLQNK